MKPRGLRNNNPGNIRNSDATDWKGEVKPSQKKDNAFEEFGTMAHGYRALIKLLQNYRQYHRCLGGMAVRSQRMSILLVLHGYD